MEQIYVKNNNFGKKEIIEVPTEEEARELLDELQAENPDEDYEIIAIEDDDEFEL